MKLRLSKQHVRYRLNEADVQQLRQTGIISASTFFGPTQSQFSILAHDGFNEFGFNYDKGYFHVTLPRKQMATWIDDPHTITLRRRFEYGDYPDVLVTLEKDLGCAHDEAVPGEDATNLYPHEGPTGGEAVSDDA